MNWEKEKLFIKLNPTGKGPLEKWSDPKYRYSLEETDFEDIAFVPPVGYVVLDADDKVTSDKIEKILLDYGLHNSTPSWATTRGRHFLFKISKYEPNPKPTSIVGGKGNILGLDKLDYKGWSKGYVKISGRVHPKNIIDAIAKNLVPELPILLHPNKSGIDIDNFKKGERHDIMYRSWIPRLRKLWTNDRNMLIELLSDVLIKYHKDDDTDENLRAWVVTNVDSSMNVGEIKTITNTKYGMFIAEAEGTGIGTSILNYAGLFSTLIKELSLVKDMDTRNIFGIDEDGVFRALGNNLDDVIRREIFTHEPNTNPTLLSPIITAIPSRVPLINMNIQDTLAVFNNGTYDVESGEFKRDILLHPNKINFDYIDMPKAEFETKYAMQIKWVKELFGGWASNRDGEKDEDIILELLELMGVSMTPYTGFERFWILSGDASNGKSEFLKLLIHILGKQNISHETLQMLADNVFSPVNVYMKLANIVTDLSSNTIQDTANLKRMSSGEPMSAQYKNKNPFTMRPYAKLAFAVNKWPYMNEQGDSDAIDRRAKGIHFRNKFGKSKQYLNVRKALYSKEITEVIIRMSLDAIHEVFLRPNLDLTESKSAQLLYEQYLVDTDNTYEYISNNPITDGEEVNNIFNKYKIWCEANNYKAVAKKTLVAKIKKYYRRQGKLAVQEQVIRNTIHVDIILIYN